MEISAVCMLVMKHSQAPSPGLNLITCRGLCFPVMFLIRAADA